MVAERLQCGVSDECGCPEEEWDIHGIYAIIHIEPDGGGHIFLDAGEWEADKLVDSKNIEQLRIAAIEWVESLSLEQQTKEEI